MKLGPGRPTLNPRHNGRANDALFDLREAQEEYEIATEARLKAGLQAVHAGARMEDVAEALKLSESGARQALGLVKRSRSKAS